MDINLVFVGEGLQRPPWEKLMHEFGLAANVRFLRQVPLDAVPSHIAGFDVGFEGKTLLRSGTMYHSPLKIYEYLAMGKPVIASAFEDSCRVIRDRETGFLFMPGDLRSLKQAIVEAFHSRDKLSAMGRVGRESVKTQHSWNSRVAQMVPEILRILEARSGIVPQETLDLAPATLTSHQKHF
jgi:glycosyltransferase involved in cell wall biosynthesis